MVDWLLIVLIIGFSALSLFCGIMLVYRFQMDDEKKDFLIIKCVAALGIGISGLNVLLLPLDSVNRLTGSTLNLDTMCWIVTIISAVLVFIVLPYCIMLREALDDDDVSRPYLKSALYLIPYLIFVLAFLLVIWFVVGNCEIPVVRQSANVSYNIDQLLEDPGARWEKATLYIKPSPLSFVIALMGFFGYVALIILGAIGMVTIPLNLIQNFVNRPRKIPLDKYLEGKRLINSWSAELLDEGNEIQNDGDRRGWNKRDVRKKLIKFERQVGRLEDAYKVLEQSREISKANPILPWISLFTGIVCIFITLIWILHIILYTLTNLTPFLNSYLVALDRVFSFFSVITFGILTYYLYLSTLSGVVNFGVNILVIRVHELEIGRTPITSLLFNAAVLIFASFGCSLFASINFPVYTRLTSINMIYGVQVRYMTGLKYVWEYALYIFLVVFAISFIYKCISISLRKRDRLGEVRTALGFASISLSRK